MDYRLRSITVWGVSLNQTFNPDVFEYSVRVGPTPDNAPEKQWEGDKATYMHRVEGVGGRITLSVTAFRCGSISITHASTPCARALANAFGRVERPVDHAGIWCWVLDLHLR